MSSKSQQVRQLNQRHAALAWWARVREEHPLGIIPLPTASRILGVTHRRVYKLVEEGRIRLVDGMPGGNERDRFIPFADLIDAPYAMTRGKPGTFGPKNRPRTKYEKRITDYANTLSHKDLG